MKTFFASVVWMVMKNAWSSIVTAVKLSYYKAKAKFRKRKDDYKAIREEKENISIAAENRIEESSNDVVTGPAPTASEMSTYVADYGDEL